MLDLRLYDLQSYKKKLDFESWKLKFESWNLKFVCKFLFFRYIALFVSFNVIFFEKILKNILLCQKKITTLEIENKHYLFILIKQI